MSVTLAVANNPQVDINLSNRNAAIILAMVGIAVEGDDGGWCGEIAAEDVHRYAQKAIRAMDDVWAQKKAEVPSTVQQGPTRIVEVDGLPTLQRVATVIDCGLTLDQIRERLRGVMAVLFEASRTHSRVIWY